MTIAIASACVIIIIIIIIKCVCVDAFAAHTCDAPGLLLAVVRVHWMVGS
jgi:hypothetical protein